MKRFTSAIRWQSLYLLPAMIANLLTLQEGFSGTDAMTLRTITGPTPYAGFGYSVAGAGDVNGDGYADFIVGNYVSYAGRAYIFLGGPGMDTIPDVTMINHDGNDFFGMCVAGAGDVNGDGYADVVVGAHVSGNMGLDSGHVYIFFGGAVMDSIMDVVAAGLPGELFGRSVAGAGDVNGDGYADVIIGAYGSSAGGTSSGQAYIFLGGATVDNVPDVIFTGTYLEGLGTSVASAGDVNSDGYDDVIVGGPGNPAGGSNRGRAYVYLGGSLMDNIPDVTFSGTVNGDRAGTTVAGAGDINSDGYDDVLVSDVRNNGRVLVYYGGSPMNSIADITLNGEIPSASSFGGSISRASDVNEDGYGDIIVGASLYGGTLSPVGRAYVYYGGASMDTIPDFVFTGVVGDRFGLAVTGADDVNGDGFNDVIVATYMNSSYSGRVYLYLSSDGPLPIQLASFTATAIEQQEVRLDWTTLSELNNYGFEVQKRSDQPQFITLPNSFIPGHGTTNEPHSYSFIDSMVTPNQWSYRLKQIDLDGSIHYSEPVNVQVLTSVKEDGVPREFALEQNYPNPFNPTTAIRYTLVGTAHVELRVYNILGQEVRTLVNEFQQPGSHSVRLDASSLASGVYFYKLWTGKFGETRKLMLLR